MAHRLRWRQLSIGILASCAILGAALFILVFGRVGAMRGSKFRLYVATDAARGLIRGSQVWLDGQRVGVVTGISFRPPTAPRKERLIVALDIADEDKPMIRLDTHVQVRSGATIIGDRVVSLSTGTAAMRAVVPNDTLRASDQTDFEEMSSEAALATREFPGIIENVKLLAIQLKSTEGTLGALGLDNGGPEMRRIHARSARLLASVFGAHGTLGMALGASTELSARAKGAMARVDSIRALFASDSHSLGRFRRDSTIVGEIARVRDELAELQRLMADTGGAVGRVRSDSAIVRAIRRDLVAVDSLRANMKKHPLRYIAF